MRVTCKQLPKIIIILYKLRWQLQDKSEDLDLDLGHSADAFVQSNLQQVGW